MSLKKFRILIADDDRRLLDDLKGRLNASGYDVITADNGLEALEQQQAQEPNLIILDILMPRMDGFQTIRELRKFSTVPVIMLSSNTADIVRIKGLNLGADDYLVKPFQYDELTARIEAVRRRTSTTLNRQTTEILNFGNISIDFSKQSVKVGTKIISLTLIEWQLLRELALNNGHLVQYEQLLTSIWGPEYINDIQILRTWISRLRNKLETDTGTTLIRTIRNTGYIMAPLSTPGSSTE